jgi:hypothetical protein
MSNAVKRNYIIVVLCFTCCASFIVCQQGNVHALMINTADVKEIAIYGWGSYYGKDLPPDPLVFNVTNPTTISDMIASIEFSVERNCATLGSSSNAFLYIKYNDGSIEIYDVFGMWSHMSKAGMRGSCYYISEQGRTLFESNTQ